MARKGSVFVVLRDNWRRADRRWYLMPGPTRLASFATRAEARAEAARREANARRRVSPFAFGSGLAELTSLPEAVFLDWVTDAGADVPEPDAEGTRDWLGWWDALPARSSVRARVWRAMDRIRCFSVAERPDVPVGYAALRRHWPYYDRTFGHPYLNNEGGELFAVYRTREPAERESRTYRCTYDDGDLTRWQPAAADLFDPETYWDLAMTGGADVVEIELHGLGKGAPENLFVVVRRTWNPGEDVLGSKGETVPVIGFADAAAAGAARDELEADIHRHRDVWCVLPRHEDEDEVDELARLTAAAVRVGLLRKGRHEWGWWRKGVPVPTESQRLALWEALPGRRAFEVVTTKYLD